MAVLTDTSLPLSGVAQAEAFCIGQRPRRAILDPRVSLTVLGGNQRADGAYAKPVCRDGRFGSYRCCDDILPPLLRIVRWLAFYVLFAVTAQLLVASGNTLLSPFAASLLMYRHVLPAFMFAFNMIATTRLWRASLVCFRRCMFL